jgi:hypothetical protein
MRMMMMRRRRKGISRISCVVNIGSGMANSRDKNSSIPLNPASQETQPV